jgi:phosphoglycolate phosphatase
VPPSDAEPRVETREGTRARVSPTVVLFDIDGTLIDTGGAGARSWARAFRLLHGVRIDIGDHTSAGETDPFVARTTFEAAIGRGPSPEELGRLYATYLLQLSDELANPVGYRVLPGVEVTLTALADAGATLGIVSGAMEGAARMKLMPGGLNRFFVFGAYGSDGPDRAGITEVAIQKAAQLHSATVRSSDVFVVGDTPLDVAAAKRLGATSVAVASGKYSIEQLRAAGADHVLASLSVPFPTMPPTASRMP